MYLSPPLFFASFSVDLFVLFFFVYFLFRFFSFAHGVVRADGGGVRQSERGRDERRGLRPRRQRPPAGVRQKLVRDEHHRGVRHARRSPASGNVTR